MDPPKKHGTRTKINRIRNSNTGIWRVAFTKRKGGCTTIVLSMAHIRVGYSVATADRIPFHGTHHVEVYYGGINARLSESIWNENQTQQQLYQISH
jgi:hypothetical protein